MRILGKVASINVRKVLWTCNELGADYLHEEWGFGTPRATSDPEFLMLNPKGMVPVLVDGEVILTESNTIVRYLASKHERDDLLPSDPRLRSRVEEMMDWQATDFNSAWRVAFQALVRSDPRAGDAEQISRSIDQWNKMIALLEVRLAGAGPYVCGDVFTVADIAIGLSVNRWLQSPIPRPRFDTVTCYFERLLRRPAAKGLLGGTTD